MSASAVGAGAPARIGPQQAASSAPEPHGQSTPRRSITGESYGRARGPVAAVARTSAIAMRFLPAMPKTLPLLLVPLAACAGPVVTRSITAAQVGSKYARISGYFATAKAAPGGRWEEQVPGHL